MSQLLTRLRSDLAGATAIEYGLVAALLCIGMIAALAGFGMSVNGMWNHISSTATNAINI